MTAASRVRAALAQLRRPTLPLELRIRGWVTQRPHPRSSAYAAYGEGSWVVPPTDVANPERVAIGAGVVLHERAHLATTGDGRIAIGDRVRFGPLLAVHSAHEVVIEDDVAGSDWVTIADTWDLGRPRAVGGPAVAPEGGPVRVCAGAYLGPGCTIFPGVTVGAGAFVGEGAQVLEDVPPRSVVYGAPAVVLRRWDAQQQRWLGDAPLPHGVAAS